ncbi:hypothetical protein [Streptomyces sp. H39-C1]|uniref:hypothetical protein n=1 Tax=Streptomyces sp. H39-C1 TaxID=3004355 RepID=UPI0022AF630D|nr:hypothetical protein [Streptomyces sp. H39-C1]MCZ4103812.1 hypothetical protein [Streptomyces sp. H39-C1]
MIRPDAQLRAGHLPADLYRQLPEGTDARSVVIVVPAPRSYAGPIAVVLAATAGGVALIWVATVAVLQLVAVASTTAAAIQAAIPSLIGGGGLVTFAVKFPKGGNR